MQQKPTQITMSPGRLAHAFLPLLLWSVLLCHSPTQAAEQVREIDALLIYGSAGIANWDQEFNQSLRNELGPDRGQYFTPEFLSLISAAPEDLELIANSLALKYSNKEIGLVVAVLPEANSFEREWKHVFAPDARTLRILPGADFLQPISRQDNTVILASAIDTAIQGTTELIPSMFPNLQRIYLVSGAGTGDLVYMDRYRNVLLGLDLPYELRYLSGLPPEELIRTLANAPPNSAIMTTTYDIDGTGRPLRSALVTEQLANSLPLPIFALSDPQIPAGAIGGRVTTVAAYARTANRLITAILNDNAPAQPVTAETDYLFNGEQLDRFGIDRDLLPPNSLIINDVPNLWRDYSRWILLGSAIIVIQGLLIAALLESIRRRRLAEAQLSRVHKMGALGTLAGGIAHDFNNILMSIMANTELLSFRLDKNDENHERLKKILSASDRAKNLVTQILMYSRQSGSSEKQVIDMRNLVEESIEQMRSVLPAPCRIRLEGEGELATVSGDAAQLYQMMMNVCVNACQAMDNKGVINLRVENVNNEEPLPALNQLVPAGHYVAITVSDSGCGISENNLQHIFEPFFTTKAQGEGTGLGLSLVYQIVKTHHGYINVESKLGMGTSITVYLPVGGDKSKTEAYLEPRPMIQGNNEHILLVDDDELVLDANRQILETLGYSVTSHANSVAALREFEQSPSKFDLVFTDLSIREMDGVRMVSNIRQKRPGIPVIICTGYLDALDPADMEEFHILRKPSSASEISHAVKLELEKASRADKATH